MKKLYATLIFLISISFYAFSQTTLNVPSQYTTIQSALNVAQTGDTVLVQPGTYYENIIWPQKNGIKLISAGNSGNTVIDGNNKSSVIIISATGIIDTNTLIKGFKITNGSNVQYGGGIMLYKASPQIDNLLISHNHATSSGGGIYISQANPIINNVIINYNIADLNGGGIFAISSNPSIINAIIFNNISGYYGGGIYVNGFYTSAKINNSVISNNTSDVGGGIYSLIGNPIFNNTTISFNHARRGGGLSTGFQNWNPQLSFCVFYSNRASDKSDAIYIENGTINISHSNLYNNKNAIINDNNSQIVTAWNNWWGNSSGPYHPTQNPDGKGDSVNAFVNVTPWLTKPDTTAPPIPIQNVKITNTNSNSIALSWDASPLGDFKGYKVYWDTDSVGYAYKNSVDVGGNTSYTITGLASGITYYIAVTCYDNSGNESWFSNQINASPKLYKPNLILPVNNSTGTSLSPTLSWSSVSRADKYRLEVNTKADFTGTVIYDKDTVSANSKQIGGLTDNTKYYWRVTALNNLGNTSDTSNTFSFTVGQAVLSAVSNGATAVSTSPTLSWDKTPGANKYRLEVNTKSDFTGTVTFDNSTLTDTLQALSDLVNNTTYYWRVTASSNTLSKTTTSDVYNFTTKLSIPTLTTPVNNATDLSLAPTLSWSSISGADKYRLEVNTKSDFTGTVIYDKDTVSANSKQIGGLTDNTKYYWRVTALNNLGNTSDTSSTFSFTTGTATGIEALNNIIPKKYSLSQNYPNPFNPSTTIRYAIPKQSVVTLKIYSVLGEEIETLVNKELNAGIYEVNFNASNLTSGVYFYRIIAHSTNGKKEFVDTKKLILIK